MSCSAEGMNKRFSPRVVFYTRPAYLDSAFPLVSALSRKIETHLIVEVSPEERGIGTFSPPLIDSPAGLVSEDRLPGWPPRSLRERLNSLRSLHLAVFDAQRAFHPWCLATCWKIARFIRSVRPHVVHFDEASTRAAGILYFLPRTPLILSIHDSQPHNGRMKHSFKLVRWLFLQRVNGLIFHSVFSREAFDDVGSMRRVGENVAVIPLGIFDLLRTGRDGVGRRDERTVLFFGRMSPYKGLETLAAAAPRIAERVPNLRLVIAGRPLPGYEVPVVSPLANGGTCEWRVGHIADDEMCELFERAAVVVVPYVTASQSGVVSTAYGFRKPVVATSVGGLPEMVVDGVTGRVVAPGDPDALAAAIGDLLLDAEERGRMSERIRQKEEGELAWPRLADMTIGVYQRALGG